MTTSIGTQQLPEAIPAAGPDRKKEPPATGALPAVAARAGRSEILERLGNASRRGRLPGYQTGAEGGLFCVAAHGTPFDGVLRADLREVPDQGSRLDFYLRIHRRLPIVFIVVLALTVWPGVYLTDELIAQYVPGLWRPWVTYYWYLPLTVLPLPWVWRSVMGKARASTRESAIEAIEKIAGEIGGTVIPAQS